MSAPKPLEVQLLEPVSRLLEKLCKEAKCSSFDFKLQLLESAASRFGGFLLSKYHHAFDIKPAADYLFLEDAGKRLAQILNTIPIHPAFSLSILARKPLPATNQKKSGAYNTDFRLAQHLAEIGKDALHDGARVLDPSSGTGILLVAVSLTVCGADRKKAADWLANSIYASDLSSEALRGARLALSSLTDDLQAIRQMWSHWRLQDSLLASDAVWSKLAPDGFDLLVGNPPWEKIKITRHEYLQAAGTERHYGSEYHDFDDTEFKKEKSNLYSYAKELQDRYSLLGNGEPDLYMAFTQLFTQLIRPSGKMAILVPAGLIRSQGTQLIRQYLFDHGQDVSITIIENRARFFAIDTRFKFLALSYTRPASNTKPTLSPIKLQHASGTPDGVEITGSARIGRSTLAKVSTNLAVPEVKSRAEWKTFVAMVNHGNDWSDPESMWYPEIVREVDMTRERPKFQKKKTSAALPVIEGRMVHQHRFGAKMYVSGTGRSAIWSVNPLGQSEISPQFWIDKKHLTPKVAARSKQTRAGFCDIVGQTNERAMMASIIPSGVVCGNKVPTIMFPNDSSEKRLLLWVGIVNSFPFDWMLRRVVTTTVNYFILLNLPLPRLEPESLPGRHIINSVECLRKMDDSQSEFDAWKVAEYRADIELAVLKAFCLKYEDLEIILDDFPLLDRGQPPIPGEYSSTITRDFLLLSAAQRFNRPTTELNARVKAARLVGALPYVPSEMSVNNDACQETHCDD